MTRLAIGFAIGLLTAWYALGACGPCACTARELTDCSTLATHAVTGWNEAMLKIRELRARPTCEPREEPTP